MKLLGNNLCKDEIMSNSPRKIDWRESPAHINLLSKFVKPRLDQQVLNWQYLPQTLGEGTKDALQRFINDGLLNPAGLEESLQVKYNVSDLKKLLKDRNLKISGSKRELAERLASADESGMNKLIHKYRILKCSDSARIIIEDYEKNKNQARNAAIKRSFDALKKSDPKKAYKTYVEFQRQYTDPRYETNSYQVESLQYILASNPKILEDINQQNLSILKAAICMNSLWQDENPDAWLPDYKLCNRFNNHIAQNYLQCHARIQEELGRISYAEKVKLVFRPGDIDSCDLCTALDGMEYKTDELPELPMQGCKSETGCQCHLETV